MAKIPDASTEARPTPQPSGGVARYRGDIPSLEAPGEAPSSAPQTYEAPPITTMKMQPAAKFLSLKMANWMKGRSVVNECAKK